MPVIELITTIHAPVQRCFDLSRSISLHTVSTKGTNEKAVAGTTKGLIGEGEWVTWRARHFGIVQELTSEITKMQVPFFFEDVMVRGAFKKMKHRHLFEQQDEQTVMKDIVEFESPLGLAGRIMNALVLTNYMKRFLLTRNALIKQVAEGDDWKRYITE